MKIFVWLATLALAVVCFSCWAMSGLIMKSVVDSGREVSHLPAFTVLLFHPHHWMLFVPVPWIVYSAALSFRRELAASSAFVYAGTILFGASLFMSAFFVAAVLPFLRMKV
jgi:hypothetical protein